MWERIWLWADTIWWEMRPASMRTPREVPHMQIVSSRDEDDGPSPDDDDEDDAA